MEADPAPAFGAAPPGPAFMSEEPTAGPSDPASWPDEEDRPAAAPPGPPFWPAAPPPPAQAAPPGPAFRPDGPPAMEHEGQPAAGSRPPGPSFQVTMSAAGSVEGPAPDLRESWLRRVLRGRRDRGTGDA
jgi:hypothetical protein